MGTSGTLGRCAAILLLAIFGVVAAFATIPPSREAALPELTPLVEALPLHAHELPAPASYVREEQFQRGDTLAVFLARLGIAELQAQRLARLRALRELRPGSQVSAEVGAEGNPLNLGFLTSRDALVRIVPDGDAYAVSETRAALQMQVAMKSSAIRSSLFAASDAAGIPDSVAIQLAEVFAGDIDFYRDLRKGDRFMVVYELYHFGGRPVRAGRVFAAEFINQGKSFRAVHFGSSYYTPEGTNLRKAFLRSPLEFSRVTSRFGMRMHPMFSTWRAHKGIDYAAAVGTRVRAVGDGIVEFVGAKGGYGKAVMLRHYGQYTTLYAHLSRFPARGCIAARAWCRTTPSASSTRPAGPPGRTCTTSSRSPARRATRCRSPCRRLSPSRRRSWPNSASRPPRCSRGWTCSRTLISRCWNRRN
jgi:murein DD-endopeptidase MepM/ murein hydrolase activator NlpD